ncbi:hypothetical protein IJ847_01875, partial [Candidatus Saccharibacteria bacterium]|nr:hypothetical protein [Candidatus Saccharibacteria bacterium]
MSNKNFAAGFRQVLADEKVKKSTAALINAKQITSEAPVVAPKAPKAPKAPEPPEASKTQETPKAPEITKTPETPKVPITPTVPKARGHNALLITAISSVVIFAGAAAFAYYQLNKPVAFIASSEQSLSESIDTDKDSNPKQKTEQESATDKVEKQEDTSQSQQDSQSTNPQDDTQNSNDKPASDSSNAKTDQTQNLGSVIGSNASALTPKNNNSNSSASSRTGQHSSSTSPNTDDVHANKTNNSQVNNSQTNNSQQQQQQQQQHQNNSGQNNSSQNNQNNQNNQTGKTDKEPKVTYKQLYAAFYANYATLDGLRTDRLLRTCTTPSTEMSCEVTAPSIQRDGFEIIGYGTAPDARESILAPGQT